MRCENGEDAWSGGAVNRWQLVLALVAGVCVAVGVLVVLDVRLQTAMAMAAGGCLAAGLLLGATALAFLRVGVRIDGEAVWVRCGRLGVPRARIGLSEVVGAFRAEVRPMAWGGWGCRGRREDRAFVIRRGPALVVELGGGRRFTVTVDDPDGAVAAISSRLSGPTGHG